MAAKPPGTITVRDAVQLTGRKDSTIRWWIKRGHLDVEARGPRRVAYLDVQKVLLVERDTRQRDLRHNPVQ